MIRLFIGYCYNGERSQMRCSSNSVCSGGQTCINGLCCKTTGDEWQNACAGITALASCTNGTCGEFVCTTSNYCCECAYGRTSGLCSQSFSQLACKVCSQQSRRKRMNEQLHIHVIEH
ncbi:unnamed protein product [Strongylus vulgaris]|uniref:EB domain-containing protein n=1 Tax=Strongylus vulgaris TaxID=40348 RepID=A0A3P7LQN1_STRVU|nr:unnamed protein product [Strongylus vulgaris]